MGLKAKIARLEDVEDAFRSLYVKNDDGSYRLDAEGVEDVTGLKSALEKERGSRESFEKDFKELRKQIDGLDPVKAREAMARIQEIENAALMGQIPDQMKKTVEEIVKQRGTALLAEKETLVAQLTNQIKERDDKLAKTQGSLKKLTLDGAIRDLASKKGVRPNAINDVIARFTVLGVGEGIRWDMQDDKVVALKPDGQIAYGKEPARPMSFEEGFEVLQKEADHLFEPSSGAGSAPGGGRHALGNFVLTTDQARDVQLYRRTAEAAQKAGQQVQIVDAA